MLVMSMVVVGAFSFFSLGLDLFPKIDFPTITITTVNPGSSPVEIETEITQIPVQEAKAAGIGATAQKVLARLEARGLDRA